MANEFGRMAAEKGVTGAELMAMTEGDLYLLEREEEVVWLEDPSSLPYVREIVATAGTRKRRPTPCGNGRLVAYATLKGRVPAEVEGIRGWDRRIWYVAPHDPYAGGAPIEAVDPMSVRPGRRSRPARR